MFIPYPLWRRRLPPWLKPAAMPLFRALLAASADTHPPSSPEAMARYLRRWRLCADPTAARAALSQAPAELETVRRDVQPGQFVGRLRLPAQWEPVETVILTWPILYPPLWSGHRQMAAAIAPVAPVTILVPSPLWAGAVQYYLAESDFTGFDRLRFLCLPTDDIWVRDYGPVVGLDDVGKRVIVKFIFDPLPTYPQERDNAMALRWAAHCGHPMQRLDLHLEGGNIWSDGTGTLLVSEQTLRRNPYLTREALLRTLQTVLDVRKLIITPRLAREETGHVDLLVKLASADTALVSAPTVFYNGVHLRAAADLLRRETNARGERYQVVELPTPPLYLNWGVYPIWRSYTNALTVNRRVLVPVFGLGSDERALRVYQETHPGCEIIPIDSRASVNGGGTVHCLSREIPH